MSKETLQDEYNALVHLFQTQDIDQPTFCKMVTQLAYQYVVQNDIGEAVALLSQLPSDYLQITLSQQCHNDEDFAQIAYALAKVLVDNHKVLSNKEAADVVYHAMVGANRIGRA